MSKLYVVLHSFSVTVEVLVTKKYVNNDTEICKSFKCLIFYCFSVVADSQL